MKNIRSLPALTAAFFAIGFTTMIQSAKADLILDNIGHTRADDFSGDGQGTTANDSGNRLVGYFESTSATINMHMVYSFQMIGGLDGSDILNADFSVSQTSPGSSQYSFDIHAHVIRTDPSPTILGTDYHTSAGLLMTDFDDGDRGANGLKSLDGTGQSNLTSYLQSNWSEGDYVFIGLKTDPVTVFGPGTGGVNDFYRFGDDGTLTVTAIPEPSAFAFLGVGLGVMLAAGRRTARS